MRLIYFCSELPGISRTFILREVESLKKNVFEVSTVSVNPLRHLKKMPGPEKRLATETVCLKQTRLGRIIFPLAILTMQMPVIIIRMAWAAVSLAILRWPRNLKWELGCFVKAVLLVQVALQRNTGHSHVHFANPAATIALIASRLSTVSYSVSVNGGEKWT